MKQQTLEKWFEEYESLLKKKYKVNDPFLSPIVTVKEFDFDSWQETKNPLFVWEALIKCMEEKIEIPAWVENYFKECFKNLIKINPSRNKKIKTDVYKALGFSKTGRGTEFSKFEDLETEWDIWFDVEHLLNTNKNATAAYKVVEKRYNYSIENIRYRHKKHWKFILKNLNKLRSRKKF